MAISVNKIYEKFFILFVGVILSVVLNDYVSQQNITGVLGTVITLTPTFFAIMLLQVIGK